MKLNILQENLNKGISLASRFTSNKAQLPILSNILIRTNKSKITILSTNLENSVSINIGAKIEEEGEIAVPSKVISEIVNNLPKGSLELETNKDQLIIKSNSFKGNILGLNTSDFPKIPDSINSSKALSLNKEKLVSALSEVVFAVSSDETRPVLTGVLFVLGKDGLTLVATDGFRLSLKKVKGEGFSNEAKFILPKSILLELLRIETEEDIKIEIQEKEKQAVFGVGDIVYASRLIEGDFPDYNKIIPKEAVITAKLDREDFLKAVKLSGVFARDNSNIVKLGVKKGEITLNAQSSNSGNQENKVEAKVEGESKDFEISFNYKFIEDFIGSVKGDEIKIEFTTTDKAGVFTDSSDSDYLHLIMPVRVQN